MSAPYDDEDEFARIIKGFSVQHEQNNGFTDPNPYGPPTEYAAPAPHQPGLTRRGKAALGISAAVLAGGGLIGYQVHSSNVAEAEAKAQEIKLQSQQLELEKLRETNRANLADRAAAADQQKSIQAAVDACVKSHTDTAGKFGTPMYSVVVSDCQNQYATPTSGNDMQAAASARTAQTSSGGSGPINNGFLIGGGALALFLVVAAKKGKRDAA
ncbi:hypothetical protein [Streptomyces xanthochromogenes]